MEISAVFELGKYGKDSAIVIPVFSEDIVGKEIPGTIPYHQELAGIVKTREFAAKLNSTCIIRPYSKHEEAPTLVFVGCASKKTADMFSTNGALVAGFNAAAAKKASKIVIFVQNFGFTQVEARNLSSWVSLAAYKFDKYKSSEGGQGTKDKKGQRGNEEAQKVFIVAQKSNEDEVKKGISQGSIFGNAANLAREIDNEPANVATPQYVAEFAVQTAKKHGFSCRVLHKSELEKIGMNSFLAVSHGSAKEPAFVIMEHAGGRTGEPYYALVGKGITFDSGGISIKPSADMDKMKYDKSGACAVIGAMSALTVLGIKKNVVGIAALTENMPSGSAYKPGDIFRTYLGKTVEVLNTDAEGRMILADALAYAVEKYKPAVVIDFATLTGACVVALSDVVSGLFSNDDGLAHSLEQAGASCGERVWRLPVWREYDEKIKSELADIKNIGEPGQGGAQAGASFLKEFVGETKWAHLDIAGTAWNTKPKWGLAVGATGVGTRLALEYLLSE
ncbi:leucyl aminopeptidase [Candidatus Parvarchaeota archaeon]|nr:leucyl aminopeptidase [Candidatus Parvarchaeota archaeon]